MIPSGYQFDFVKTRADCVVKRVGCYQAEREVIKPLRAIYNHQYKKTNTFIVDDNPSTFSENTENGILIRPFEEGDDDELMGLVIKLEQLIRVLTIL